jgi:hypothetical protein
MCTGPTRKNRRDVTVVADAHEREIDLRRIPRDRREVVRRAPGRVVQILDLSPHAMHA